jgi:uncharacterized protein YjiS (DUF1127 family)
MSRDSARCASANDIQAASSEFPVRRRRRQIALSWLAGIALWRERRRQHRQLLELDDRLLADIGISRQDAVEEALKSSLTNVLMWQASR